MARALGNQGCRLVICARNPSRLARVEKEFLRKRIPVLAISCDVRDERSVTQMVFAVRKKFGHLDILVNSAGIAHPFIATARLSLQQWNEVIATNLTGTFLVTRAALPLMKRGADIVNILSISAKRAFPELAAYNASKFGALGYTNTLREELRKDGIRITALLPGATDTPIWETLWPETPRKNMIAAVTVAQALVDALRVPHGTTIEEVSIMPTAGAL